MRERWRKTQIAPWSGEINAQKQSATDVETARTWPQRAPAASSCVIFTYQRLKSIQAGWFLRLNSSRSCSERALIFKTNVWQQGGEDRGISEGQQAGCCQVTTFKALENLLFPGSTPSVCFLAVCASVNELREGVCVCVCVCTLETTVSLSKLSGRQTSSYHCKNQTHKTKTFCIDS